ncbi:hypothetical protein BIW11_02526 [Tropilaelaps mercedesae]|uniref:Uncharacterized protein n=1 Tax=Tropilaelaps mercedesae TaxID=418985 RepID=A0A1V9Y1T1_9ACAR|nr:hypothetical protein BIW11_02526 [Tropilaelaps mercedesae]
MDRMSSSWSPSRTNRFKWVVRPRLLVLFMREMEFSLHGVKMGHYWDHQGEYKFKAMLRRLC